MFRPPEIGAGKKARSGNQSVLLAVIATQRQTLSKQCGVTAWTKSIKWNESVPLKLRGAKKMSSPRRIGGSTRRSPRFVEILRFPI
jgi:hypothetical protein